MDILRKKIYQARQSLRESKRTHRSQKHTNKSISSVPRKSIFQSPAITHKAQKKNTIKSKENYDRREGHYGN